MDFDRSQISTKSLGRPDLQNPMGQGFRILEPDGPLLIFGGAYSNLEATAAVLAEAARLGIPPARVICTGDIVAYGADAAATATLVRDFGCHVVMGNCEESLASGTADCGCGFPVDSACQRLSSAWFNYADRTVGTELRSWMANLPRRIDVEIGGARLAVVHGGAASINRFIFASTPASIKIAEIDRAGVDGIIGGHCGIPFTQIIDGRLWHNSGAVGMPANDGTSSVWYSILKLKDDAISIEHRLLDYDYRLAAEKMRSAGLPEGYAAALETGIWPSCDALPFKEIRERGVALVEGSLEWRPHQAEVAVTDAKDNKSSLQQLWPREERANIPRLPEEKFKNPTTTAAGQPRASVSLKELKTLWINTGTLCNITCRNCYIESSPRNDRLVYIRKAEVQNYLDEISEGGLTTEEIGFTGGEPFMNPEIIGMLEACLDRGFKALILTNGMRPMERHKVALLDLNRRYAHLLSLRVSLDHYTAERHEEERGPDTFVHALSGLKWLCQNGFRTSIAGRTMWGEDPAAERDGYVRLLSEHRIAFAFEPGALILFPEMEPARDVPEITTACWDILHKSPDDVMCSSSRMVIKRKGAAKPAVVACTLLPYEEEFELGHTLKDASRSVPLNHPFCSQFCVLGGSSCSGK